MGILSSAVSITRYRVEGKIKSAVTETIAKRLRQYVIAEIDDNASDKAVGWTSFENPFQPNFEGTSFVFANLYVFTLRIDRKSIPTKMLKKHVTIETEKRLANSPRRFLSKNEKSELKDKVSADLLAKIPSTPHLYDLIWDYDNAKLNFFSNLRSANEEVENLFKRSFNLSLIRIFPYTAAEFFSDLSVQQRDSLITLSPTRFSTG